MPVVFTNPAAAAAKYADHVRVAEMACTTGTEALVSAGAYNPATVYGAQQLVTYNGALWLSLQGGNQGNAPAPGSAWWTQGFGLDLKNIQAVQAAIELPAGVIGNGASLQYYGVNLATGSLLRMAELDQNLTQNLPGQLLKAFTVPAPIGKLIAVPNQVGVACWVFLSGIVLSGIMAS